MGTLLNFFNIKATYNRWKAKRLVYEGQKCIVVIEDLEIKEITYSQQDPPSPEEIKDILNSAVLDMTKQITAEFGF